MNAQREMPFVAVVKAPEFAPWELVKKCKDRLDAIRLCVQLSGRKHYTLAEDLGIDPGHFARMMQGTASFPDRKSLDLIRACGNMAPAQFESWSLGYRMEPIHGERIRELEAEIERLRGAA